MSTSMEKLVSPGHDVVERTSLFASLGVIIAFAVKLGAMFPFMDSDLMSNAMLVGALIVLFVPLLACFLTGPFWVHDVRRRIVVQVVIACFALVSCIVYLVDMTSYGEWMGVPAVEQLGLHFVYSFYPVLIYLCGAFSSLLVSGSGFFTPSLLPPEKDKNAILVMALAMAGIPWIAIAVLSLFGPLWSLLVEVAIHGVVVAARAGQLVDVLKNIAAARAEGTLEQVHGLDSLRAILKNGRNGILHGVRGFLGFVIVFLLALGTGTIIVNVLIKASFIPLWIEFFPAFMATAVAWGIVYRVTRSRFAILLAATALLSITGAILQADPYALLDQGHIVSWLSAATLSGVLLGSILHARSMAIGRFSQPFWGFGTTFFLGGGLLVTLLMKWDYYCTECFQVATYVGLFLATMLISARVLSMVPAFWNKGKRALLARGVVPEYTTHVVRSSRESMATGARVHGSSATASQHIMKVLVVLAVVIGLSFTGWFAAGRVLAASTEHVLGSHGSDYYLWQADSLRSIDMNYRPDLPSSPVNSTTRIEMARGEHEGFQVVLTPWRLTNLNVHSLEPLADLSRVGSPSDRIGKGNITSFIVDYVPQLANQFPDRLLPFKRVDTSHSLAGRQNWPFYIDVGIPADDAIEPGTYRTTMRFHCYDYLDTPPGIPRAYVNRDVTFTLEVVVFNFTVPVERHVATEIIWGIPDNPAWHDFYADHRLDWFFAPRAVTAANTSAGHLSITFDWTTYLAQLDEAFAGGMKYFPVTINGFIPGLAWGTLTLSDDEKTVFGWYLSNLTAQLSARTTPWGTTYLEHAYYFVQDEPSVEIYPGIIRIAQFIHSIAPDLKVMETMNQDLSTYPDAFLRDVDIYCFHIHQWEPSATLPDDGSAEGWPGPIKAYLDTTYNATGNMTRQKELWVYHTHNRFPTTDTDIYMQGILQRNSFWLHWTYGVPGWLYWSFNWGVDGNVGGYGYAYYGESTLVGWGEDGDPVGSLRLERVRDGIEDYEYFWLLNSTIAALDGAGHVAEATAARALLARVDGMYNQPGYLDRLPLAPNEGSTRFSWSYEPMAAPYLQIRHEIGVLLGQVAALGVV